MKVQPRLTPSFHVYWPSAAPQGGDQINKVAKSGGVPRSIATAPRIDYGIAVHADSVYFVGCTVASDGSQSCDLTKVPAAGGAPVILVSGRTAFGAIAVDDTGVYWLEADSNASDAVMRVRLEGGTPTAVAAWPDTPSENRGTRSVGIALDAHHVYFTDNINGRVYKAAKTN